MSCWVAQGLVSSRMLKETIEGLPVLQDRLSHITQMFDVCAARADGKMKLSRGSDPDYDRAIESKVRPHTCVDVTVRGSSVLCS